MTQISIVTSSFNSEEYIETFVSTTTDMMNELEIESYEILVVDDGSTDNSVQILKKCKKKNSRIRVLEFSRNFGHHLALFEGIKASAGDWVYLTDSDMEESPNSLKIFLQARIEHPEVELFQSRINEYSKPTFKKLQGYIFWWIISLLSKRKIKRNLGTSRFFTAHVREIIQRPRKGEIFLPSMFSNIGVTSTEVSISKTYRGESNYTFAKKWALFTLALTCESQYLISKVLILVMAINALTLTVIGSFLLILLFGSSLVVELTNLVLFVSLSLVLQVFLLNVALMLLSRTVENASKKTTVVIKQSGA